MEYIETEFKDLQLSSHNPRFTFLEDINSNMVAFIKRGNKNYCENNIVLTLLQNEGDLQDMLNLMNSIVNSGWIDLGEKLIAVKSDSGKYIVAEGNRRLLALKLLFKNIELPEQNKLIEYSNNQDMHFDDELMEKNDMTKNYEEIKNIIKKYNRDSDPKLRNGKLRISLASKSNELWTLLYTKHISGERPGMRQWRRGKYFVDILNFS